MNINLELYKIFYEVAKTKNITKASRRLMISQPAISKSIKNLEEQLGGELFIRSKRGVSLTSEGEIFFNHIEQAMLNIDLAEDKFKELANLESGTIRIGISTTLTKEFLIKYLKTFHSRYPDVDIYIDTSMASKSIPKLKTGLLDVVILNLPNKEDNDIEIIECREVQDIIIASPKFQHLTDKTIKLKELDDYPLILQDTGSNTRTFFDNFCKKNNVYLNPHISLASYTLVVEFTKIGLGIGYATKEYIKDDLDSGNLIEIKVKPEIPKRSIGIAISKHHKPSFSTKKLIEIIKANL